MKNANFNLMCHGKSVRNRTEVVVLAFLFANYTDTFCAINNDDKGDLVGIIGKHFSENKNDAKTWVDAKVEQTLSATENTTISAYFQKHTAKYKDVTLTRPSYTIDKEDASIPGKSSHQTKMFHSNNS